MILALSGYKQGESSVHASHVQQGMSAHGSTGRPDGMTKAMQYHSREWVLGCIEQLILC